MMIKLRRVDKTTGHIIWPDDNYKAQSAHLIGRLLYKHSVYLHSVLCLDVDVLIAESDCVRRLYKDTGRLWLVREIEEGVLRRGVTQRENYNMVNTLCDLI